MNHVSGYGRPGIGSTLGVLIVGMAACAAWAWSAYPAQVRSIAGRLTSSDYVLLAVFVVVGLVAATMLASMIQALMQLVMAVVQVALLVGVAIAGVILWRTYGADGEPGVAPPAYVAPSSDGAGGSSLPSTLQRTPLPDDPEERRLELEAELRKLDTRNGSNWWEHH